MFTLICATFLALELIEIVGHTKQYFFCSYFDKRELAKLIRHTSLFERCILPKYSTINQHPGLSPPFPPLQSLYVC